MNLKGSVFCEKLNRIDIDILNLHMVSMQEAVRSVPYEEKL